ncbi:MAG: hypothetical protein OEZ39_06645 [Gammaproteobacteria bacterium]|nr:hypothetical protein [Gammaproteobacteria bacterium]MDH5651534.1 hypothetical protein [Gammaproteobacteria bacterium]
MITQQLPPFEQYLAEMCWDDVLPWNKGIPLYPYIKDHIDPVTGMVALSGRVLPDQGNYLEICANEKYNYSFGDEAEYLLDRVALLMQSIAYHNDLKSQLELYDLVLSGTVPSYTIALRKKLTEKNIRIDSWLVYFLRFLLREGPDRGPIMFALIFLDELVHDVEVREIVRTLGLHKGFAIDCAVAIHNSKSDFNAEFWYIFKHAYESTKNNIGPLLGASDNSADSDWLFYGGYQHDGSYNSLGYLAATYGELKNRLLNNKVDERTLFYAADIIYIMLDDYNKVDEYHDAAEVFQLLLQHILHNKASPQLVYLLVARTINNFVHCETESGYSGIAWDSALSPPIYRLCEAIIAWPDWESLMRQGLASSDMTVFRHAQAVWKIYYDVNWDVLWGVISRQPLNLENWHNLFKLVDQNNIEAVANMAAVSMPWNYVTEGPPVEGVDYSEKNEPFMIINLVLSYLKIYPGKGRRLIEVALQSRAAESRLLALTVLELWSADLFDRSLLHLLKAVQSSETDSAVEETIQSLLDRFPKWRD